MLSLETRLKIRLNMTRRKRVKNHFFHPKTMISNLIFFKTLCLVIDISAIHIYISALCMIQFACWRMMKLMNLQKGLSLKKALNMAVIACFYGTADFIIGDNPDI